MQPLNSPRSFTAIVCPLSDLALIFESLEFRTRKWWHWICTGGFSSPHLVWDSESTPVPDAVSRLLPNRFQGCFVRTMHAPAPTLLQRRLSSDPAARLLETPPRLENALYSSVIIGCQDMTSLVLVSSTLDTFSQSGRVLVRVLHGVPSLAGVRAWMETVEGGSVTLGR
ncbi:unnamed protein product [Arctogadus glacialis]